MPKVKGGEVIIGGERYRREINVNAEQHSRVPAQTDARRHAGEDEGPRRESGLELHDRSPWRDLVWLPCRDGKARPAQSGIQPLASGVPNRVGTLRGAGNAIVPQAAAEVIAAFMETEA